jgi:hypothetical protein
MLTDEQRRQFASDGYVRVPGIVDESWLQAADAEIDELVAGAPAPAGTVGAHFYFLPPDRLRAADAALRDSGALALADELVAPHHLDHALDHIQVALNIPPYRHRPGAPHLDGHRPDEEIGSFTMLAAIFLADESMPDRGNLWVWPGSHRGHAQLFRERGVDALKAGSGHAITLDPPAWFGPASLCSPGAVTCCSPTTCSATASEATRRRTRGGSSTTASPLKTTPSDGPTPSSMPSPSTRRCANSSRPGLSCRSHPGPRLDDRRPHQSGDVEPAFADAHATRSGGGMNGRVQRGVALR